MRLVTLITGVAFVLLLLLNCCEDDCPICHRDKVVQPYRGWLYYTDLAGAYGLYKVDIEMDSVVDSLSEAGYTPGALAASSDGHYLAMGWLSVTGYGGLTRIYDAQTLSVISDLSQLGRLFFDAEEGLLLMARMSTVTAYQAPSFALLFEDTIPSFCAIEIDHQNKLLYTHSEFDPLVKAYNYSDRRVIDSLYIVSSPEDTVRVRNLSLNEGVNKLYFLGAVKNRMPFGCYDISSREVEFTQLMGTPYGDVQVSPGGDEVYVTDPGHSGLGWTSGTVYVFDAHTGDYMEGISLYGYLQTSRPLAASEIAFTPIGERAYVASGLYPTTLKGSGAVLVIDTEERRISKLIPPELGSIIGQLAVCPKL